jgi:hypothetical protein
MSIATSRPWRSFALEIQNAADEPPAPAPIIATRGDRGGTTSGDSGSLGFVDQTLLISNGKLNARHKGATMKANTISLCMGYESSNYPGDEVPTRHDTYHVNRRLPRPEDPAGNPPTVTT